MHIVESPVAPTFTNLPLRSPIFYPVLSLFKICLPIFFWHFTKMKTFNKKTFPATTACPTARTAMPLTIWRPTILQPFHTSPSLPLPSMGCLTMVCPTVDCSPTMGFQPTPTLACPALPTTPLPLPLQRGRRSRTTVELFTNVLPSIVGVF